MSRSRFLGQLALTVLAASATAPFAAASPLDVSDDFNAAIDLWKQGRNQEALDAMRRIIASDPDASEVYEAYLGADADVLTSFMAAGDEYTLVAKRFLERAGAGRKALERDEDRIKEAISGYLSSSDPVERIRAINAIAASHGEYAAPRMINLLADDDDPDRVRQAIGGLMGLGDKAVLPLIAALSSDNETQRRNAAMTLGFISDPRAGAHLLAASESDASDSVRGAAAEAAARCGASGSAAAALLGQGDAYHHRRSSVLFDRALSDVVWSFDGGTVVPTDVPSSIYSNELAKDCYYKALALDPESLDATAGIARESVDIAAKLDALASAGQDVGGLQTAAAEGMLAVESAGLAALDRALQMSVVSGDAATGARLAGVIGQIAGEPTPGLNAALTGGALALQGEAAVALAHVAVRSQSAASAEVVDMLGRAAARRVVKVAVIIDGDAQRAASLVDALAAQNVLGQHAGTGTQGIVMLGQLDGVDAILVGDDIPDLTADAVVQQVRLNPAYAETPAFLLTSNEELADAFGDRINGSFAGADGIDALQEVFDANLDDGRARADALAGRAAAALGALAGSARTDVSGALSGLEAAIDGRGDHVAIPALGALAQIGSAGQVEKILAVLGGGDASDEVRIAAANAIGSIGSRNALAEGVANSLRDMVGGDASIGVRSAAARALGRMNLGGSARAGVIEAVRVRVGGAE